MKWIMAGNKTSLLQEYSLTKQGNIIETLKYNPVHRSARISIGDKHKLFFIESAGSLSGKYIFKNEYGMEVGGMSHFTFGKDGEIIIERKKFIYKITSSPSAELTIYDSDTHKPLASCGLGTGLNGTPLSLSQQNNNADSNYLLLGLCWFLFSPMAKENIVEYAA